jgi:hypothetical protein
MLQCSAPADAARRGQHGGFSDVETTIDEGVGICREGGALGTHRAAQRTPLARRERAGEGDVQRPSLCSGTSTDQLGHILQSQPKADWKLEMRMVERNSLSRESIGGIGDQEAGLESQHASSSFRPALLWDQPRPRWV